MKMPLLLLHGALGAASQFDALKALLSAHYEVHTLDFSGHGGAVPVPQFSIAVFARDVVQYLEAQGLSRVAIFGYSMGGYVALYLARHFPEKVTGIVTLATKLHWDEPTALKETALLDTDKIVAKVPQFAAALQARHTGQDWKTVAGQTAAMLLEMGRDSPLKAADFALLQQPVLLLLGDRDKMVGLDETVNVYRSLPDGQMGVLPGTPHPYEAVAPALLGNLIQHFMERPC